MPNVERPPARVTALHLGLAWGLGMLLPLGVTMLLPLLFFGGAVLIAGVLAGLALVAVLLWVIVTVTPTATALGSTAPRRILWVLLMHAIGTPLLIAGWFVMDQSQLRLILSGLPYAIVAGLLVRRWQVVLGSGLSLVALVAVGAVTVQRADYQRRLQQAGVNRDIIVVATIPGYRPSSDRYGTEVGSEFLPEDPARIPQTKSITIVAYGRTIPNPDACGPTAQDSHLTIVDCETESSGLIYRRGVVEHGYQVRRGEEIVEVAGTLAVDRGLLRDAALAVHPATPAERRKLILDGEFFVADVPGFQWQAMGIPHGVQLEPTDPAALRRSVYIQLYKQFDQDEATLCFRAVCQHEGADLIYLTTPDSHGYIVQRGAVAVSAIGGVSVDREVLRQAALTARPPTDEELLHALPPKRPGRRPLDLLRQWMRGLSHQNDF